MLRKVLTGLFVSFLVSLALLNLSSRFQDKKVPVDLSAVTADDPFTRMDDLIRQYLILSLANQQTQSALSIIPAFHLSGIIPRQSPTRLITDNSQINLPEKYYTVNLLEFCCRLNI